MLYNQELRDAGRAFNSKPFRTAPPKQHDAKERLHGSDRCPCSHISQQDRLASGRRRGRLLPHRHVRRRHGGAPAVRAAWGEELGLAPEDATVGKIIDALKRMGINYVFDTTFSADLTIMEEGNEFVKRFTSGELKDRTMFTSCCQGWVRFIKSQFPHLVKYLSSAKSPQQMFGAVMKTYFAAKLGVSPEKI